MIENDKKLRRLEKIADKIDAHASAMEQLSDEQLREKQMNLKPVIKETLDELLPEAFAVVREAAKRVLGLFPYRVQLMGGIVLHDGTFLK